MKQRRIISAFAAVAVAAAALITPVSDDTGFSIKASAATPTPVTGGKITVSKVDTTKVFLPTNKGADGNRIYTKAKADKVDIANLKKDDLIQLNIEIPQLNDNIFNYTLEVTYDSSYFEPVVWYKKGDETSSSAGYKVEMEDWPSFTGHEIGGYDGEANYAKVDSSDAENIKRLSVTGQARALSPNSDDYNDPVYGTVYKAQRIISDYKDSSKTVYAVLKVKDNMVAKDNLKFEIVTHEFMYNPVVDPANIDTEQFYLTEGDAGYDPTADHYDPNANTNLWGTIPTADASCSVSIPYTLTGTIKGVKSTTVYLIGGAWCLDPKKYDPTATTPLDDASDGKKRCEFSFTGVKQGSQYDIYIKDWIFPANTKIKTFTVPTTTSGLNIDMGEVEVRLYGDVNDDGEVNALDATIILKYIVGKNQSYITSKDSDNYAIANVLEIDDLNATDATQILRKSVELASIFTTKQYVPPVTP
ncbi:MAG: dockerin type I repeat-containing protein [Ruminiclostridium sp.]|nr:dockerin type I repeat-containing protein [Ruminiclostridium sp.]